MIYFIDEQEIDGVDLYRIIDHGIMTHHYNENGYSHSEKIYGTGYQNFTHTLYLRYEEPLSQKLESLNESSELFNFKYRDLTTTYYFYKCQIEFVGADTVVISANIK
jgi:hypothetical protein